MHFVTFMITKAVDWSAVASNVQKDQIERQYKYSEEDQRCAEFGVYVTDKVGGAMLR